MSLRAVTPTSQNQRESRDSIGIGKISEGQLKAVIQLIKSKNLLNEPPPLTSEGRGIVIAGGGRYLSWAWVNCRWIRHLGIELPIQVWFLGPKEMPAAARKHFENLNVELVDAFEVRKKHWHRRLITWHLKQYSAMRAPWREVLSVDADCFIEADPAHVFDSPEFQEKGAFFCADVNKCRKNNWGYFHCTVPVPDKEMESGYFAWDRVKSWEALKLIHWLAEHSEILDQSFWGEKDYPYLGFGNTKTPYIFDAEAHWMGYGIQHRWKEQVLCNHIMATKRGEHAAHNLIIPRFFEEWRSFKCG